MVTKHTPSIYKLIYKLADRPQSPVKKSEVFLGLSKYQDLIKEYEPDGIIATHFFPAAVASHMYTHIPIPNGVVLTDYISHHIWVNAKTDLYFVAHQGMAQKLHHLGVPETRIKDSGIPIRPCFSKSYDQRAVRLRLGFDPDLPLVLIMSGGNAIGPLVDVLLALGRVNDAFQVAVITGHNQKLYIELQHVLRAIGLRGRIMGFVDYIHEYMAAADLLISKAGGSTVAEALSQHLPMVIIRPTPGQEDGNTEFLTSVGAAVYVKNIPDLPKVVEQLLQEPVKLRTMSDNAGNIAKPLATDLVLKEMENLITERNSKHMNKYTG